MVEIRSNFYIPILLFCKYANNNLNWLFVPNYDKLLNLFDLEN